MFGHDENHENDERNNSENQPDETQNVVKPDDKAGHKPADDNWQHPGPPPADDDNDNGNDDHDDQPAPFPSSHDDSDSDKDNELIDLKQEVLGKLSPLVGHLDQSPQEKFRTLMMMIQASDNQQLVREAYETALKIDDEKERAQALLDIVNEINYFTQHSDSTSQ